MEEIFAAIEALGLVGFLVFSLWKSQQDKTLDADRHTKEIKYYRSLAFSLLTVVFIVSIEDENKIKAVVESLSRPADEARID